LVAVLARLGDEHDLVDAGVGVGLQQAADLVRRADRAPHRVLLAVEETDAKGLTGRAGDRAVEAEQVTLLLELLPHVGTARLVTAEYVVMQEGGEHEVAAAEAAIDGGLLVSGTHERQHAGDVRLARAPPGHTRLP